jgi:muramoyltetrapeptide carboxypeptidase LdcA involved in peptidoglycan recycling
LWPRSTTTVPRLARGSRVAIVSPSNGLAPAFPGVFEQGLEVLRSLGLEPVEFPTARMSSEELYKNPAARAKDLHDALRDDSIAGVIATIGGYESVRLLPLLETGIFRNHPKLMLGGSDATTFLLFARRAGLPAFYGPSVMSGFAQAPHLPDEFRSHLVRFLFDAWERFDYSGYPKYSHGYTGWDKTGKGGVTALIKNEGFRVLHGSEPASGHLWGGCIEVLEFLKGTKFWPQASFFDDAILFFETSEEKPPPERVGYMLRNYGVAGILKRASGLLLGRPKDYTAADVTKLHDLVRRICLEEFRANHLVIIADVDIGHTDPKWIVPIGGDAQVDPQKPAVRLTESPFASE